MTEQPDPDLAQVADALRAAGYEVSLDDGCIQSELDGVPFALTFEHPKLGFYCFVAGEGLDISLARLNALNRDLQFAKFALDDEGNLIMAADFIVDPADPGGQSQLEQALSVWSAALAELRDFIASEASPSDREAA